MAVLTTSLAPSFVSNANAQANATAIHNTMVAGGWVQTADTGQMNPATVAGSAVNGADIGYLMYRSNDSTGSLHEIYVKITLGYGVGNTTPIVKLDVGFGSNGTGTINSTNKNTQNAVTIVAASTTLATSTLCAGTGYFCFGLWQDSTNHVFIVSVERTRDSAAAQQDEIFFLANGSAVTTVTQGVVPFTGVIPTQKTAAADNAIVIAAADASYSSNFGVGTIRPLKGGFCNDSMNMFLGNTTHFSAPLMQFSFTVYGASHNYIALNVPAVILTAARPLLRYE